MKQCKNAPLRALLSVLLNEPIYDVNVAPKRRTVEAIATWLLSAIAPLRSKALLARFLFLSSCDGLHRA